MFYIQLDSRNAEFFNRNFGIIKFRFPTTLYFPSSNWLISLAEFNTPSAEKLTITGSDEKIGADDVIYIKTDAVEAQITSSTYSRLLKAVPVGSRYQETQNRRLCRLDANELSGIEIHFTTNDNRPIAIVGGDVCMSLLFQRLV